MKRYGISLLLLALFTMSACKRRDSNVAVSVGTPAPAGTSAEATTPGEATRSARRATYPQAIPGKFNAAFVYIGPVGDGGWTYAHDQGRRFLEAKLGVHTAYVESVSEGAEGEQVIRGLARKGFDLIVATSFGYMDAMEAAARDFPGVKFVHVSGHKSNGQNFGNLFGAMESMKYLAGMIAGARAKADGKPKLGYIAPYPIPEVVRLANAVMLGARQSCPECVMEIRWINSWFDPNREREAADSLLKAGVQVVVTGADTPGPITAARDAKAWGIGYDSSNACQVAPARCLTTPFWSWGPIYVELVKKIRAGSFKGTSEYLDVASGIVGLDGFMAGQTIAPGVPEEVRPKISDLLAKMQAGSFTRFDVFAGPLKDNRGREVLAAAGRLTQQDLEGLPGCTVCMSWLAQGIIGELPARKH